jgi:hypothetical protein
MAALTTNTGLFGAKGASCPATLMKMVDYNRAVDFGEFNTAVSTNYDLLPIPKGFLVAYIAVEQTKLTAADKAITFGTKNADTVQLGGTFTLDDTTLLRQCDPAKSADASDGSSGTVAVGSAYFSSAADTLCLKCPASTITQGAFVVHMIGYQTFGESLGDVASGTPAFASGQTDAQAAANVSGGDPMFH